VNVLRMEFSLLPNCTVLTCPLCRQMMHLPVTLLCCGVTTCEQCCLLKTGQLCTCGVVVRGREGFLYNEDAKLEIEKSYQKMCKVINSGYSKDSDKNKIAAAADIDYNLKVCLPSKEADSFDDYVINNKRKQLMEREDMKKVKRWKKDMFELSHFEYVECAGTPIIKDEKKFPASKKPSRISNDVGKPLHISDNTKKPSCLNHMKKSIYSNDIKDLLQSDQKKPINPSIKIGNNGGIGNKKDIEVNLKATGNKVKDVLIFLDLQKLDDCVEKPFSQIGCFFNQNSSNVSSSDASELKKQLQSFHAVITPDLNEFNKDPELWTKYFVFDEFYYKHAEQAIRCVSEETALEKLIQYLAKIKLKFKEVNICLLQRRGVKDLMRRVNLFNMGSIFFPNVDGFVLLEDAVNVKVNHSSAPEHSDLMSKFLYDTFFHHLCENYYDIHRFPIFRDLGSQLNTEEISKSLYIGDLSLKVIDKDLYKKISRIAKPLSVKVCLHPKTRTSLGYAYVNFSSEEKAEKVLKELQSCPLFNKPMRIMYYNKRAVDKKSHLWKSNIFVKNLDPDIDNKKLQAAFGSYGQILSCKVSTDDRGRSKGFGFVQFKTEDSAWKAINDLHGLIINDKELYVCIKKTFGDRRLEEERCMLRQLKQNSSSKKV